jgi:hypothetical protein
MLVASGGVLIFRKDFIAIYLIYIVNNSKLQSRKYRQGRIQLEDKVKTNGVEMDMWKLIMTHSKDKYIASFSQLSIFGILLRLFIRHNSICG